MDDEFQYQSSPSPIHLDHFEHQGPPVIDPNLTVEDIARLRFHVAFLS